MGSNLRDPKFKTLVYAVLFLASKVPEKSALRFVLR
jgi:hypothetical protein